MLKKQILELINNHHIFHLATCVDNVPYVRHMLLYRADENGIIFHTSFEKDVCQQILENNNIEMCFFDLKNFLQIRVSGKAIVVQDDDLKDEIISHPSRQYLQMLRNMQDSEEFFENLVIFKMTQTKAHLWSIPANYNKMKNYEKNCVILD